MILAAVRAFLSSTAFPEEVTSQDAAWTEEAFEAVGGAEVLDVGQTGRSVHHQAERRAAQVLRVSAGHSLPQVIPHRPQDSCDELLSCSFELQQ